MNQQVEILGKFSEGLERSGPSEDPDRVDLTDLGGTLWRRKWVIATGTLAGAALSLFLTSQITPRYTASASVMLEPRTMQVLTSDDVVSDLTLSTQVLQTEISMLRSNLLLERVINSFEEGELDGIDPALVPPSPLAEWKGGLKQMLSDGLVRLGLGQEETEQAPVEEGEALSPEELRLRRLVGEVRRSMTVWRVGESYVIAVSVETVDPKISAELADRIVTEYISQQIDERSDLVRTATSWLSTRLDQMSEEVEAAERAVESYKAEQLLATGVTLETISQQLLQLNTQLIIARADTATAEARSSQIEQVMAGSGLAEAAELVSSPFVLSLREELSDLERQDAVLATQFEPQHPDRKRLQREIELVQEDLAEEVRKIVASLRNEAAVARTREDSISNSLSELEQSYVEASRASLGLRQLEREAEAVRGAYAAMLTRLNETRSLEQLQRADARIVDRAIPPGGPSSPRTKLFAALGGACGFALGLVLAFLSGVFGGGFATATEIERKTGLPVLAVLPRLRWRSSGRMLRSLQGAPYQPFMEQVRQVRVSLANPRSGIPIRSVLVTSSVQGEGKTATALALAFTESLAKKRVLLLDLDARRSSLAREFRLPPGDDLAGYVRNGAVTAVRYIDAGGFDLLTVLRPEPGLVDELDSDRLTALLDEMKEVYDTIIIDAPAVLAAAETLVVSQVADATLFLVRHQSTSRRAVRNALARLREMRSVPAGIIVTMTGPSGETRHGFETASTSTRAA